MILFVDASSLIKRYLEEVGSDAIREMLRRPEYGGAFYVSDHIVLEVFVRLAKHLRAGGRRLRRGHVRALRQFEQDRSDVFNVVTVSSDMVARAEELAVEYAQSGAGTLDLLHAASALHVRQTLPAETFVFVVSDKKLRHLVRLLGFHVFDPEHDRIEDLPPPLSI